MGIYQQLKSLWLHRSLISNLTVKELKLQYKHSILGFAWSVLNPLLMLFVYTVAFKFILRSHVPHFTMFILTAELPWMWWQGGILAVTNSLVNNANLIQKVYFPREIIPLSITFSTFINFCLMFVTVFIGMAMAGIPPTWNLLWLPVVILNQLVAMVFMGLMLSVYTVRFRDIYHLMQVLLMAWFYLSPVVYPLDMVPEKYQPLLKINLMSDLIEQYRRIILSGQPPLLTELIITFVVSVSLALIGFKVFKYQARNIAEFM